MFLLKEGYFENIVLSRLEKVLICLKIISYSPIHSIDNVEGIYNIENSREPE